MKCEFGGEHSSSLDIFPHWLVLFLGSAMLFMMIPQATKAQMFSVGEEKPRFNAPQSNFHAGFEAMNVTYQGSNPGNPERGLFEFDGPVIRLGYNSPLLNLFLGTGGAVTGIEGVSYFDFGGDIKLGIPLYNSETVHIAIPVRITSRYINMTNSEVITTNYNRFQFGSLTAGAGGRILFRPVENFRFELGAVPQYGFAFASGGFFGGSQGSIAAHGRLYFDHLFGDLGLSLGYKYDLRNYDIDENANEINEDVYDYKMKGHIIELGITF